MTSVSSTVSCGLNVITPNDIMTPQELVQRARELYTYYNQTVFGNQLSDDMPIVWKSNLFTTIGRAMFTLCGDQVISTTIELSTRRIDREERLQQTLCHEMCHVATFLIDKVQDSAHGPQFRRWATHAMSVHPHLEISRCVSYETSYKYTYRCINTECNKEYGRQTRSILSKHRCAQCRGHLKLDTPVSSLALQNRVVRSAESRITKATQKKQTGTKTDISTLLHRIPSTKKVARK